MRQRLKVVEPDQLGLGHINTVRLADKLNQPNFAKRIERRIILNMLICKYFAIGLLLNKRLNALVLIEIGFRHILAHSSISINKLQQLVTLNFTKICARQLAVDNRELHYALVRRLTSVELGEQRVFQILIGICNLHLLHLVVVETDKCVQHIVVLHHGHLFNDRRRGHQALLQLYRIDILAVRQHNYLLLAACYVKVSVFVDIAQIARVQPPIDDNLRSLFGAVVVALHNVRAFGNYLTINNFHLNALEPLPGCADTFAAGTVKGNHWRSLAHSVAFQHGETQCFIETARLGWQRRATANHNIDMAAKCFVNFLENNPPDMFVRPD